MFTISKRILAVVLALGVSLFFFSSCSDDIVLEPLDSLLGEYEGQYTLTDLSQGGTGVKTVNLSIKWIFRDFTYELEDITDVICSPRGEYKMNGDRINLDEKFDGGAGTICDPDLNPLGDFSLRRPDDSLILTQSINDIFAEIRLKKIR